MRKIGSEKVSCASRVVKHVDMNGLQAQAYVRSLPFKKKVPFEKVIPTADPSGTWISTPKSLVG
jgi:hypothetical protein